MGLLCLKYTDRQLAADVAYDFYGHSEEVDMMYADLGVTVTLDTVAHQILSESDFCDTLAVAERIKAEQRGEFSHAPDVDTDVIVKIH